MPKVKAAQAIASLKEIEQKLELIVQHSLDVAEYTAQQSIANTRRFKDGKPPRLRPSFQPVLRLGGVRRLDTTVPYAKFIEFGTKFIQARKFAAHAETAGEVALYQSLERRMAVLGRG